MMNSRDAPRVSRWLLVVLSTSLKYVWPLQRRIHLTGETRFVSERLARQYVTSIAKATSIPMPQRGGKCTSAAAARFLRSRSYSVSTQLVPRTLRIPVPVDVTLVLMTNTLQPPRAFHKDYSGACSPWHVQ